MNLAWLVAVIDPDLLVERSRSSDHREPPEAELARAMQGRILRSPFDDEIGDTSVRAVYETILGDEHALDVLVESLSAEEVRHDPAKLTALTLVACALLAERDDVPTCLRIIDDALTTLDEESPSAELCKALALQQRALRRNDLGEPPTSDLDQVRQLVDRRQLDSYPEFNLRANTGTSPRAVVENILDALRSAAQGFDLNVSSSHVVAQVISDIEDDRLGKYRRWLEGVYETKLSRSTPADYGPDSYFETCVSKPSAIGTSTGRVANSP